MKLHRKIAGVFGYELIRKSKLAHVLPSGHLHILLAALDIDCVLDVGANRGQYARGLRDLGFSGRIVSFEPVAENFRLLEKLARGDPRWEIFDYALGAEDGRMGINVTDASDFASFHTPSEYSKQRFGSSRMNVNHVEEVEVKRLDGVFEKLFHSAAGKPRIFLKMDTQGHDLEVFRGAADSLAYIRGLQSELAVRKVYNGIPDLLDALAVYRRHGYEITGLYPVSRDNSTQVVIEYDCMMRRLPADSC